jgi:succinate dehydrogenase/fumarate reductase cytochrome b subunit
VQAALLALALLHALLGVRSLFLDFGLSPRWHRPPASRSPRPRCLRRLLGLALVLRLAVRMDRAIMIPEVSA